MFHDEPNSLLSPRKRHVTAQVASLAHALAHERLALVSARDGVARAATPADALAVIDRLLVQVDAKANANAAGQVGHA